MLTIKSAMEYMQKLIDGDGAQVVGATETTVDGIPTVTVEFLTKNKQQEFADVWIEGNRLYGEW